MNMLRRLPILGVLLFSIPSILFSAPVVTECDTLAANPLDPKRVAIGVAKEQLDAEKSVRACRSAFEVDPNNLRLMYQYARALYFGANNKDLAFDYVRKSADQGYAMAQEFLGARYFNGEHVAQDDKEAARWYRKAADQGISGSQVFLGFMYEHGRGVKQDDAEAVKWYRKAAEQGNADAQVNLGIMYSEGRGFDKDDVAAAKWYRKAAEQGNARGQDNLGFSYDEGLGVKQDNTEAVKWYRKAADQGINRSQVNLGFMYEKGLGVKKDDVEAVKWYRKAAEQGNANAQVNLGVMYRNGNGVKQDDAEAVRWYSKAAEQGDATAQNYLDKLSSGKKSAQEKSAALGSSLADLGARCALKNANGQAVQFFATRIPTTLSVSEKEVCGIAQDMLRSARSSMSDDMQKFCASADESTRKYGDEIAREYGNGSYEAAINQLSPNSENKQIVAVLKFLKTCKPGPAREALVRDIEETFVWSLFSIGNFENSGVGCRGYLAQQMALSGEMKGSEAYSLHGLGTCASVNFSGNEETYHPVKRPNSIQNGKYLRQRYKYDGELPTAFVYKGSAYPF